MTMNSSERLRRVFVKNIDLALIVVFLVTLASYALLIISSPNLFSYIMLFSLATMIFGQFLIITPFGQAYFFYFYSFFAGVSITGSRQINHNFLSRIKPQDKAKAETTLLHSGDVSETEDYFIGAAHLGSF